MEAFADRTTGRRPLYSSYNELEGVASQGRSLTMQRQAVLPSGRLPFTIPKRLEAKCPAHSSEKAFKPWRYRLIWKRLYVGYRYSQMTAKSGPLLLWKNVWIVLSLTIFFLWDLKWAAEDGIYGTQWGALYLENTFNKLENRLCIGWEEVVRFRSQTSAAERLSNEGAGPWSFK